MKVQKQLSKKVNGKTYYKYVVIIPESELKKAEIKGGDEVEVENKKGKIVFNKK